MFPETDSLSPRFCVRKVSAALLRSSSELPVTGNSRMDLLARRKALLSSLGSEVDWPQGPRRAKTAGGGTGDP